MLLWDMELHVNLVIFDMLTNTFFVYRHLAFLSIWQSFYSKNLLMTIASFVDLAYIHVCCTIFVHRAAVNNNTKYMESSYSRLVKLEAPLLFLTKMLFLFDDLVLQGLVVSLIFTVTICNEFKLT